MLLRTYTIHIGTTELYRILYILLNKAYINIILFNYFGYTRTSTHPFAGTQTHAPPLLSAGRRRL